MFAFLLALLGSSKINSQLDSRQISKIQAQSSSVSTWKEAEMRLMRAAFE